MRFSQRREAQAPRGSQAGTGRDGGTCGQPQRAPGAAPGRCRAPAAQRAGLGQGWPPAQRGQVTAQGRVAVPVGEAWGVRVSFCPGRIATLRRPSCPSALRSRFGSSPPGSGPGVAASPGTEEPALGAALGTPRRGEGAKAAAPGDAPGPRRVAHSHPGGLLGAAAETGTASPPPRPPHPAPAARRGRGTERDCCGRGTPQTRSGAR